MWLLKFLACFLFLQQLDSFNHSTTLIKELLINHCKEYHSDDIYEHYQSDLHSLNFTPIFCILFHKSHSFQNFPKNLSREDFYDNMNLTPIQANEVYFFNKKSEFEFRTGGGFKHKSHFEEKLSNTLEYKIGILVLEEELDFIFNLFLDKVYSHNDYWGVKKDKLIHYSFQKGVFKKIAVYDFL